MRPRDAAHGAFCGETFGLLLFILLSVAMSISVKCPRCNGAVSIADQAAGQRVKCPHCDSSFLAPGVAATTNDDDDWLNLDEVPLAPAPPATSPQHSAPKSPLGTGPSSAPSPKGGASNEPDGMDLFADLPPVSIPSGPVNRQSDGNGPSLTDDEEDLLAQFTDEGSSGDLGGFDVEMDSPPKPHPSAALGAGRPASSAGSPTSTGSSPKPATSTEYETEFRVKCKICDTLLYVHAHQSGKTVKCPDCHAPVTVPPPPKVSKKNKINIADAETFQFEETKTKSRGPDPFKKSADQLLEEASREEEASEPNYDDVPSVKEWLLNVFGIFRDLGVLAHWLILSVLAGIPAAIAVAWESKILLMGMFPAGFFLTLLVVSCGFAIMHAVANEEESVSEWPTLDPANWLNELFMVAAATCLVVAPVWLASMLVIGPTLTSLFLTMFAVFTLFPFVLLSMLDMNSVFIPFSPELARSVSKSQESWGGFYFSSGLLFFALFLFIAVVKNMEAVGIVLGITATIGVAFAYFGMIGRLAFAIGQEVNAPPRDDQVDRTRQDETA